VNVLCVKSGRHAPKHFHGTGDGNAHRASDQRGHPCICTGVESVQGTEREIGQHDNHVEPMALLVLNEGLLVTVDHLGVHGQVHVRNARAAAAAAAATAAAAARGPPWGSRSG
jgi:hypothetical protein